MEISLRFYHFLSAKQLFGLNPSKSSIQWQQDPILGRRLTPNQTGWYVTASKEYYTPISVNSHGWRDSEHAVHKPENTYRILILGDSFVENFQVQLEDTFFKQIENNLQIPDKKIEVIAMGLGNTGTAQQLIVLNEYGVKYQPDLIVHMFLTANDIKNNSPTLQNNPYQPYVSKDLAVTSPQSPNPIKEKIKKINIVDLLLSIRHQYLTKKNNLATNYPIDYHVYDKNYSNDYQETWETTKKLILESKNISEKAGATYLFVTLANNEQINSAVWQEALSTYPKMNPKELDMEKPDNLIKSFCKKETLSCLHMLPYFKHYIAQNPNTHTHFHFDGHWNELGTNLAASFLTTSLPDYIISQD